MRLNPVNYGCIHQPSVIMSLINMRSYNGCLPQPFAAIYSPNCGLTENPVVSPSNTTQVIRPSAANRQLGTVTVVKQTPAYYTTKIAGTGSDTVTVNNATKVSSSDTAVATATISGEVITITGVAAGTAAISVFDVAGELIATVYTVVTA